MFGNTLSSTFGQLSSPTSSSCIFSKLSTTGYNNIGQSLQKPKPCSTEKFRPSAILCAEHLKAYFNMGIKQEKAKPSDNSSYITYYSLKFAASPDILLPFPMKLRPKRFADTKSDTKLTINDFEFCLDQSSIQNGFSGNANYLPPRVLGSLLSNSHLSDIYITDMNQPVVNPGVGQLYTPLLMANTMVLEKYWENVQLLVYSETEDELFKDIKENGGSYIRVPMSMLPGFYKFIFYYSTISNSKSTKSEVINEYHVMPPNVILNLDIQAFEIINKGVYHKIFTYSGVDGIETITTPIILCAEKSVPDIKREYSPYN
jgi:hypothetical protein